MTHLSPLGNAAPFVADAADATNTASRANEAAGVHIEAGQAQVRLTLPAAVAWTGAAHMSTCLVVQGKRVPLTVRLLDGPVLQLVYGDHTPPCDFADFRVYASAPGLGRIELGGSSCAEGLCFQSMPLAQRWQPGAGDVVFAFPVG